MWKALSLWRQAVLERDGHKCIQCGETKNLHADHIKPFINHPELRTVVSNGRTLCATCHYKTDTFGAQSKSYNHAVDYDYLYGLLPVNE